MSLMSYLASAKMHGNSLHRVLHAPMSFFDTTPTGMHECRHVLGDSIAD
jgi:hypothetical protein